jgi:hypothetical protein
MKMSSRKNWTGLQASRLRAKIVIRLPLKTKRNEYILFVRDLAVETVGVAEGCAAAVGRGHWGFLGFMDIKS